MSDHHLSTKLHNLHLVARHGEDEDDLGEGISADSVGFGGRSTRKALQDKQKLNVSPALRAFLVRHKILDKTAAGVGAAETTDALREMLGKSHFSVPAALLDRSKPLPEYFISSSHNTYLMAGQLYGSSSAEAYETALKTGSRCVEIDAWDNSDNPDEPKVTHGFTLVSHISFRDVCETIRDVFDEEKALADKDDGYKVFPILLSLENHCGDHGQRRLVAIMKEVLGDRLLSAPVREKGHREQTGGEHVLLAELGACIAVIVEYNLPKEGDKEDSDTESSDENEPAELKEAREAYKKQKKDAPDAGIVPELAELGVYAQSVKPVDNSWFNPGELVNGPPHHLINVSESGLSSHLPAESVPIAKHNAQHLMRVYPKGTRIGSSNLKAINYWAVGAQICALNWQTFGTPNQLNDAMFSGSEGYVLKPAALRSDGSGDILGAGKKKKLRLHVAGATDVPVAEDREADSIKPYLTCNLYSPGNITSHFKQKTDAYKHHKVGILHRGDNPPVTEPIWNEVLEWEYDDNELVFLRMLMKSDDRFARNPRIAVAALRVLYAVEGWCFVRMLDMKGRETKCTVLVKIDIEDV